ncbi:Dimer-Tnp-hAT domain-containing protein [Mycena indigotica]|uniref:Dimer-Tnp-hAT domain-containing protein n=1 Tax=Mycena indigotica TaxID=2126181 RepID=A0A8H6SFB5_9AGAR|nr:Dimer-Tnp-hAT domain-containing protein [Mycena indigotica]KAF7296800.1 Dimer-Tnp-hAT domain-containing protein [Mycena indigotica]
MRRRARFQAPVWEPNINQPPPITPHYNLRATTMGKRRRDTDSADTEPTAKRPKANTPQERDSELLLRLKKVDKSVDVEDNDAVLALQVREWEKKGTETYSHYKMPPLLKVGEDGIVRYVFSCKRFPSKTVQRARYDASTSNLGNHIKTCQPGVSTIKKYTNTGDYNHGRFRLNLALWIAVHNRPHLAVKDAELVAAFRTLQPNVHVPCNDTVARDIKIVFDLTKPVVKGLFAKHDGALHAMLDGWTSPNVLSMVGLVIQFVVDNDIRTFLLDMIPLSLSHTGSNLARALSDTFKEYGIEKKILGIVGDNASNNDTMMESLVELMPKGARLDLTTRIRCFAHVLNLVVKAILSLFVPPKGAKRMTAEEEDEFDAEDDVEAIQALEDVDEAVEASDAAAIEELDLKELVSARELDLLLGEEEQKLAKDAYRKLNRLGHRIFNSERLRQQLTEIAVSLKLDNAEKKRMIRAILTRWNTIYDVITRGLELQPALDRLCTTSTGRSSIKSLLLSNDEWQLMSQLRTLLKPFKDATIRFSKSKFPRIFEVIPVIDLINEHLEDTARLKDSPVFLHPKAPKPARLPTTRRSTFNAVRMAAVAGLGILDKYYAKTDESVIYRIAMLLHPSYGMAYFDQMGWEQEWKDLVVELARTQWIEHYRVEAPTSTTSNEIFVEKTIFDKLDITPINADPFEHLIASPPIPKDSCLNPLLCSGEDD